MKQDRKRERESIFLYLDKKHLGENKTERKRDAVSAGVVGRFLFPPILTPRHTESDSNLPLLLLSPFVLRVEERKNKGREGRNGR